MKFKDSRDVLTISSEYNRKFVEKTNKRRNQMFKPEVILKYNKYKEDIDHSNYSENYHR